MNRRKFLAGLIGSTAAGLVGSRHVAFARVPVDPVSILVVDFNAAWNVHATFAARTNPNVNPYGIYEGDTGIVTPSPLLFRERDSLVKLDSAAWGQRIPGFEDAARRFSIIGAMRHSLSYALDDHVTASRFGGTGYLDRVDVPGLGTVIGRYAPQGTKAPPAIVINAGGVTGDMARAPGVWQKYAPIRLLHYALPARGEENVAWAATEAAIDETARKGRRSLSGKKLDTLHGFKEAFRTYRRFFLDPAVDPTRAEALDTRYRDGMLGDGSPTTRQLLEALGGSGYPPEEALALAIRCIEGGSRFVGVGIGMHDTHSGEDSAWQMYPHDAQLLAGLSFLLEKTGLASKVLVVALSEMARSPYEGFYNAARGTDHGASGIVTPHGDHGSNRQTILLAHGPVVAGREVYPAEPEFGDPVSSPCITAELLALLAECAGVERTQHPWSVSPDGVSLSADVLAKGLFA